MAAGQIEMENIKPNLGPIEEQQADASEGQHRPEQEPQEQRSSEEQKLIDNARTTLNVCSFLLCCGKQPSCCGICLLPVIVLSFPMIAWICITLGTMIHCNANRHNECSDERLGRQILYSATLFLIVLTADIAWYWSWKYLEKSKTSAVALLEEIYVDAELKNFTSREEKHTLVSKITKWWTNFCCCMTNRPTAGHDHFITNKKNIGVTMIAINICWFILIAIIDGVVDCAADPMSVTTVFTIKILDKNTTVHEMGMCFVITLGIDLLLYGCCILYLSTISMMIWLMCHSRRYQITILTKYINDTDLTETFATVSKVSRLMKKYITDNKEYNKLSKNIDHFLSQCLPFTLLSMLVFSHLFVDEKSHNIYHWLAKLVQVLKISTVIMSPWYLGALRGFVKITTSHTDLLRAMANKQLNFVCTDNDLHTQQWAIISQTLTMDCNSGYYSRWLGSTVTRRDVKFILYGTIIGIVWTLLNSVNDFF